MSQSSRAKRRLFSASFLESGQMSQSSRAKSRLWARVGFCMLLNNSLGAFFRQLHPLFGVGAILIVFNLLFFPLPEKKAKQSGSPNNNN